MDINLFKKASNYLSQPDITILDEYLKMYSSIPATDQPRQWFEVPKELDFSTSFLDKDFLYSKMLSSAVFKTSNEYDLMSRCLAAQFETKKAHYIHTLFKNDPALFNRFASDLKLGKSLNVLFQIAADLFGVSIILMTPETLKEYSPPATSKEDVWFSTESTDRWEYHGKQSEKDPSDSLRKLLRKMKSTTLGKLTAMCQQVVTKKHSVLAPTLRGKVHDRLLTLGFKTFHTLGDGNCEFRTISRALFNDDKHHALIRRLAIYKMKHNPSQYENKCSLKTKKGPPVKTNTFGIEDDTVGLKESWEHYFKRMSRNLELGDQGCLQALSDAFMFKLVDFRFKGNELVIKNVLPQGDQAIRTFYCCSGENHMEFVEKKTSTTQ